MYFLTFAYLFFPNNPNIRFHKNHMLFFQVTLFPYFMPKRIPALSSSERILVWNTKVTTLFYCSDLPCDFWSHYQHPKLIITYIFRLRFTVSFFLPSSLLCPTFLVHYKLHSCYAHSFLIKLTEQQFHIIREEEREREWEMTVKKFHMSIHMCTWWRKYHLSSSSLYGFVFGAWCVEVVTMWRKNKKESIQEIISATEYIRCILFF